MIAGWPALDGCSTLAHRGGAALGPANTLEVVERSVAAGAHAVEIDLQELADGSLVLFHDSSVEIQGVRVRLAEIDARALSEAIGEPVVQLAGLLAAIAEQAVGLYLDVKRVSAIGLLRAIDTICATTVAERTVIGSFDRRVVGTVSLDGRLRASILYRDRHLDPLELALSLGCAAVHPCFDDEPWMVQELAGEWMERVHSAGLAVVGWNSNDAELLAAMRVAGFDVLCTDDPRLA
ncbi:MAG: glycerophosphodiester phosphodiesterase [Actinomycetota bacterium]|nr:glycerophosphodiester phosphodiesterase [Actinomycetota bacterium]